MKTPEMPDLFLVRKCVSKLNIKIKFVILQCIVKTNSQCLSSQEEVYIYIFQFQQATIFIANVTLLFQPQLNTTMYIQLQMIKHINHNFVVLHTGTQKFFHVRYSGVMHKKSIDAPITTKDKRLVLQRQQVCIKISN